MKNYSNHWRNKIGRVIMKLALFMGGINYRRELLLDFRMKVHPADAHNVN